MAFEPPPEMIARLDEQSRQFEVLTDKLTIPAIISNRNEFQKLSRERAGLEDIIQRYQVFRSKLRDYQDARVMLESEKDAEMRAMAMGEITSLEPQLSKEIEELQLLLLPKDPNDEKNVVLEIRAGVGGDEAGIFAGDLYRMYQRYAEGKRFRVEILSITDNSAGGLKEVIALIEGDRAYSTLKYESGVHRVQRVPKTEAQGRIHTSTATVAVLPEAEEVELEINPNELRIDVYRAGGHGGQSVNTTDSAVRITHLPTNEVVVCQDEKSQLKNKNKAMKVLRTRLLERMRHEQQSAEAAARRSQVGGGFRNERIRTYNFPQGRITDHRIGMTAYNLDEVVGGKLDAFINAIHHHYQLIALRGEDPNAPKAGLVDDDA
jgi:peptide chain release factor 1